MNKLLSAVAALALTCAAGQALAGDMATGAAPQQAVAIAGVDFRDAGAVRAFYDRLRVAAHAVCDSNSANPRVAQADQLCVDRALAQAVRSADRPLLTALFSTSHEAQASR